MSLPPVHEKFLKYYRRLVRDAGGAVPARSSVRPADIKPMLPWVAMAERQGADQMVPTVIGSAVDEVLKVSFTGLNLFDYYPKELAARMNAYYSNITDTPCGGYMERTLAGENGLLRGYQSSLYPLVGSSGRIDRLVGIVSVSKTEPLLAHFGKPRDIATVDVAHEDYIDIGFGLPERD